MSLPDRSRLRLSPRQHEIRGKNRIVRRSKRYRPTTHPHLSTTVKSTMAHRGRRLRSSQVPVDRLLDEGNLSENAALAAQDRNRLYESLLNGFPNACILLLSGSGTIRSIHGEAQDLLGISAQQLLGCQAPPG